MANGGEHFDEVNIQVKDESDAAMVSVRKRAAEPDSGKVEESGGDGHVPSTGSVLGSFEIVQMPGSISGLPPVAVSQRLTKETADLIELALGGPVAGSMSAVSPASGSGGRESPAGDLRLTGAGPSGAGLGPLASLTIEAVRVPFLSQRQHSPRARVQV